MTRRVYVGVSGFSYPSWRGKFYPEATKSEGFLPYYSQHLRSVEINSSFYAQPGTATVRNWSGTTGEDFKFAFKAPRQITHISKLGKGSAEVATRFSSILDLLGPKRGPILFQLPPYVKQDLERLEQFLTDTSGIVDRVFEFRHASWFQGPTYRLLDRHTAGFCIVDSEDLTTEFQVTGESAYFRLRKESYDARTIDQWAERIRGLTKGARESYVYLRHDETGENAVLAQRLSEKLDPEKG